MPATSAPTGRNVRLDVVRGIAILLVMAHHQPWAEEHGSTLTGGWLGVDLFYALSGFLIVTLMLTEHARTGRVSRWSFAVRRARRLIPALLVLLLAWTAAALAGFEPAIAVFDSGSALIADAWGATLTGTTNWWLIARQPYPIMFTHLWSLAVEWQFYVAAAICVPFALRHIPGPVRRPALAVGLLLLAAVAAGVQVYLVSRYGAYTGYLNTVGRAPALLSGAAAAVMASGALDGQSARVSARWGWVLVAGICAGLAVLWATADKYSEVTLAFGVPLAGIACGTLLWALATAGPAPINVPLLPRVLAWCGRRSYSAYLWNWTLVFAFAWPLTTWFTNNGFPVPPAWSAVTMFTVTWVAAVTSWRLIEKRWLRS